MHPARMLSEAAKAARRRSATFAAVRTGGL